MPGAVLPERVVRAGVSVRESVSPYLPLSFRVEICSSYRVPNPRQRCTSSCSKKKPSASQRPGPHFCFLVTWEFLAISGSGKRDIGRSLLSFCFKRSSAADPSCLVCVMLDALRIPLSPNTHCGGCVRVCVAQAAHSGGGGYVLDNGTRRA